MKRAWLLSLVTLLASWTETNRRPAIAMLAAEGASTSTVTSGAYTVTLDRADVAIGPLFLCATRASSADLCETAVLETQQAFVFDALDPTRQSLGFLDGVTGHFRTAQFDQGLVFLLGATAPAPLPPAEHSALIEGNASDGTDAFDFSLAIDVVAAVSGQSAIVGRHVEGEVPASGGRLVVRLDPAGLVRDLPWASIAALPRPATGPVVIERGTLAYEVAVQALVVNHPLTLAYEVDTAP